MERAKRDNDPERNAYIKVKGEYEGERKRKQYPLFVKYSTFVSKKRDHFLFFCIPD